MHKLTVLILLICCNSAYAATALVCNSCITGANFGLHGAAMLRDPANVFPFFEKSVAVVNRTTGKMYDVTINSTPGDISIGVSQYISVSFMIPSFEKTAVRWRDAGLDDVGNAIFFNDDIYAKRDLIDGALPPPPETDLDRAIDVILGEILRSISAVNWGAISGSVYDAYSGAYGSGNVGYVYTIEY